MGGLKTYMPTTRWTYLIATFAIAGIPLFAGFFSKDEILFKAFEYGYDGHPYAWFVWIIGLITALLTAFYMMRRYMLTFEGEERWPAAEEVHAHESPKTITIPLIVLAFLSTVGGFLGIPAVIAHGEWNWIHGYLAGHDGHPGPVAEAAVSPHGEGFLAIEWGLIVLSIIIAVAGVYWAYTAYKKHGLAYDDMLRQRLGSLYRWWQHKYYWDEAYDATVVDPIIEGSRKGLAPFDEHIVDGGINGLAKTMSNMSNRVRRIQTGVVQNYALAMALGVVLVIALMLFG